MKYSLLACTALWISCTNNSPASADPIPEESIRITEPVSESDEKKNDTDTIFDTGIRETQELVNESGGVTEIKM
jgi:hypothetical protein